MPEAVVKEIEKFQIYVKEFFGRRWEFEEIMTLLLRYSIKDFDSLTTMQVVILKSYFSQKTDMLDEFYLNTIRSSYSGKTLCTA